jgi:tetratricopeptide (TPR) repeat protein
LDRRDENYVRPPVLPRDLDLNQLPRGVRAELRGLSPEKAEYVGGHLLMAGKLIDSDPELAHRHAAAAKQSAPRLPIVREAVGETAYAAADFTTALTEFRALRRMSGTDEYLPAMADCERALGRSQAALKLIKEGLAGDPEVPAMVELRLVEAGVRADTGKVPEALRLLQAEIESVGTRGPKIVRARLRYAYADLLEQVGQIESAERWFEAAASLDADESTDAADRVARLRGVVIEFDESEDDEFIDDEADELEGAESDVTEDSESDDLEDVETVSLEVEDVVVEGAEIVVVEDVEAAELEDLRTVEVDDDASVELESGESVELEDDHGDEG